MGAKQLIVRVPSLFINPQYRQMIFLGFYPSLIFPASQ